LQLTKANEGVYFSADNRELKGIDLYDIIRALSEAGYKKIFIDEIHTKPDWDKDLKTAHDDKLAYIAFTGSSAIKIKSLKADLSRRLVIEHLPPASFREWVSIKKGIDAPLCGLNEIIKNKGQVAKDYGHLHKYLDEYNKKGGVLYEAKTDFHKTILSMLDTIATKDLSILREVGPDVEECFFKTLQMVATASKPMELSYSKIGETIGKNKVWVMRFLSEVEKTGVIKRIYPCGEGVQMARKEAKYYLPIPYRHSLCFSLGKTPDIGAVREEFFANHVECCYIKTAGAKTPDFKAEKKTFEVGGARKGAGQKADYIVVDGLDVSSNHIPLFMFGLLY